MTHQRIQIKSNIFKLLLSVIACCSTLTISSCGLVRWHSIEQIPAEPIAFIRGGVFVSGDYARGAQIIEIDGEYIDDNSQLLELALGKRQVKIMCGEAKGNFDTQNFSGQERVLEFEAKIQRTYKVGCVPHTHWWVEDLENQSIVAGEKFN